MYTAGNVEWPNSAISARIILIFAGKPGVYAKIRSINWSDSYAFLSGIGFLSAVL